MPGEGFREGQREVVPGPENRRQTAFSFVSVLTLTVLLAGFAMVKLAAVHVPTVEITEHRIPAMQSLSDLKAGLFQYRIPQMFYVFTEDPDERELRVANMDSGMKTAQKAMAELAPQAATPEEHKLLATIQQDIDQCQSETQAILALIHDKKTPDATPKCWALRKATSRKPWTTYRRLWTSR